MRTALITFAVAGMTMAAKTPVHHGEETVKPVAKGPTPVNKPYVHWGEQSYAQAAKKGAKLAMFKLPSFSGEDLQAFKARLGVRLAGLKQRLHHFGETATTHGKRLGHKARQGMRKFHHHGEESHVKKHANLALFKLPSFSGETSRFSGLKKKITEKAVTLKNKMTHNGEESVLAVAHKKIVEKVAVLKNKIAHHGEESTGKATIVNRGAWAFLKKSATVHGEETTKKHKKSHKKVHSGESSHKHKNPLSKRNKRHAKKHAGEDSHKKASKKAALGLYELSSLLNSIDA